MDYGCDEDLCEVCARRIQVCWRSHQSRKVFKLLMKTVRSAEECCTPAVLRQLSPREANLLRDPSLQCKVRIRFAGPQFPPVIVFKIFHTGRGGSYLSGKKLFQPSNRATVDTCRMMGNRKFMDLMMEDEIHWQGRTISHPADVMCIRDYMQYSSHLDELPAHVGGRENGWRRLSLKVLSRGGGTSTAGDGLLREELSGAMVSRQTDQPIRSPVAPPSSAVSTPGPQTPKRRLARARMLTARMRRIYTLREEERVRSEREVKDGDEEGKSTLRLDHMTDTQMNKRHTADEKFVLISDVSKYLVLSDVSDCEWEEEAELLCSWSNQLTLDLI